MGLAGSAAWAAAGCACCAAAAVRLLPRGTGRGRAIRVMSPGGSRQPSGMSAAAGWWRAVPPAWRCAAAGAAGGAVLWAATGGVVAMLLAPAVVSFTVRRRRRASRCRAAAARRGRVTEVAVALAAELRAGRDPVAALAAAVAGVPGAAADGFGEVVAAARAGADVPAALEGLAGRPGASGLRRIAACWRVAVGRGASAAAVLERVAAGLRDETGVRAEVEAELAGVRATARLLAGLPLLGVVLGTGLGADPVSVLFRTSYGVSCLVAGLVLVGAGLAWTDRLADRAAAAAGPG